MNHFAIPPKSLLRCVGRAITDYAMIQTGDRVLLGLSGGKDSLSLLHILAHLQHYAPIHFELGIVTVDPQIPGFDPSPLKDYLASLNLPYFYRPQAIMAQAQSVFKRKAETSTAHQSFCAYCARMKRGILYTTARQQNYTVLALGQHLDDLAESFLMSALYNGDLRTMKAHYTNDTGDVRVIRPLVYARERQTAAFAHAANLPIIPDNCPACFAKPSQRQHIKTLLATEEKLCKPLFKNLLHALRPLMTKNREPDELN
ncbi:MAG: tRNA 2-thiocytidine(32) synthetase TtcA [Beggiatoa sp. IS2]|nr:MAG: tRNA 2-thiocytidine(32) synthetase TtcA [Beggiatoa sp. IS2]